MNIIKSNMQNSNKSNDQPKWYNSSHITLKNLLKIIHYTKLYLSTFTKPNTNVQKKMTNIHIYLDKAVNTVAQRLHSVNTHACINSTNVCVCKLRTACLSFLILFQPDKNAIIDRLSDKWSYTAYQIEGMPVLAETVQYSQQREHFCSRVFDSNAGRETWA